MKYHLNQIQLDAVIESSAAIFLSGAGTRLAVARMALLMDQKQLAQILQVSVSTISNVENGTKMPRFPIRVSTLIHTFGIEVTLYVLQGMYQSRVEPVLLRKGTKYWTARHSAQGYRVPFRDRFQEKPLTMVKDGLSAEVEMLKQEIEVLLERKRNIVGPKTE